MFGPRGGLPRRGPRNYGGSSRGHHHQSMGIILALLGQVANLRRKPPVTLALMAAMTAIHFRPELLQDLIEEGGLLSELRRFITGEFGAETGLRHQVRSFCMLPSAMWDSYQRYGTIEWHRFFLSAFIHADDMHLYYNMASFLWKGVSLELTMGSRDFAGLLVFSLVTSQLLMLLASWVLLEMFDMPGPMSTCTVGFSGVLFALKYVLARRSPGVDRVLGFKVHTRYAAWLELVLIYLMVPGTSFLGHLAGILAGILYFEAPSVMPALSLLTGLAGTSRPSYQYASGTAAPPADVPAGSAASRTSDERGSDGGRGGAGWSRPAGDGLSSSAEDADLQEAMRRSLLDARGGRNGGGWVSGGVSGGFRSTGASAGGGSSRWSNRGVDDDSTVDVHHVTPSAPPEMIRASGTDQREYGNVVEPGRLHRRHVPPSSVDL